MTAQTLDDIHELAQQLRVDSIRCSTAAGSGHPTSSMSAADVMAVLLARHLRYDWQRPDDPANDHLIFSKGHASPLLYSMFKAAGVVSDDELMSGYRRFGSRLEGHPTPVLPWVDVATGSLGQGLPDGVGVALAGRYLDELPYRVWVLSGTARDLRRPHHPGRPRPPRRLTAPRSPHHAADILAACSPSAASGSRPRAANGVSRGRYF